MAYAVGHISGGHFNPAITLGVAIARRFRWSDVLPYVVTQVVASVVAAVTLLAVANGKDGFDAGSSGFASNGYDDLSPEGYSLLAVIIVEVVLTAVFLFVILGSTDTRAPKGFAPIAIGLSLTLIHLVSIPVSNTSVNPARSTGPALFADGALAQLWVFWVAPLAGAAIAGRGLRLPARARRDARAAVGGDRGLSLSQAQSANTVSQSRAMLTTVQPSRAPTSVIGSASLNVSALLT